VIDKVEKSVGREILLATARQPIFDLKLGDPVNCAFGTLNLQSNVLSWTELEKIRHLHILDLTISNNSFLEKDNYCKITIVDFLHCTKSASFIKLYLNLSPYSSDRLFAKRLDDRRFASDK